MHSDQAEWPMTNRCTATLLDVARIYSIRTDEEGQPVVVQRAREDDQQEAQRKHKGEENDS